MRLEAERELGERVKEDQRRQAEIEAREREEAAARKREEDRLAAEEARRVDDACRQREEDVRFQAIRDGERERARLEAENAGRLEALRAQQQHEQELAVLGRDKSKRRAKWIAIGSVLAVLAVGTVGGVALWKQAQRTAELERQIGAKQREIDEKQLEIDHATTPEQRKALEDQRDALQRELDARRAGNKVAQPVVTSPPPPVQNRARTAPTKKDDVCEEIRKNPNDPRRNDPMNGCL